MISIREYNYRFKNSVAYYELLVIDAPYTDYHYNDKEDNNSGSGNKKHIVDDDSIRKTAEAIERMKKKFNKKD